MNCSTSSRTRYCGSPIPENGMRAARVNSVSTPAQAYTRLWCPHSQGNRAAERSAYSFSADVSHRPQSSYLTPGPKSNQADSYTALACCWPIVEPWICRTPVQAGPARRTLRAGWLQPPHVAYLPTVGSMSCYCRTGPRCESSSGSCCIARVSEAYRHRGERHPMAC